MVSISSFFFLKKRMCKDRTLRSNCIDSKSSTRMAIQKNFHFTLGKTVSIQKLIQKYRNHSTSEKDNSAKSYQVLSRYAK